MINLNNPLYNFDFFIPFNLNLDFIHLKDLPATIIIIITTVIIDLGLHFLHSPLAPLATTTVIVALMTHLIWVPKEYVAKN